MAASLQTALQTASGRRLGEGYAASPMSVHICQNSLNYILELYAFYFFKVLFGKGRNVEQITW